MTFVLGLTGSIGMGKSTTAKLFRDFGVPVHDADGAVHRLYQEKAVPLIGEHFPAAVAGGAVDRTILGAEVLDRPDRLKLLESIVHPLVRAVENEFICAAMKDGAGLVVLDIPLLFETGGNLRCDAVVVVSAPAHIQRERVLARPGMNPEKLDAILARQIPDGEKRRNAHFLVDSSHGVAAAACQVHSIIRCLSGRPGRRVGDRENREIRC
jgi:dephospho-CoA kinase